jgi:hypothetical protein
MVFETEHSGDFKFKGEMYYGGRLVAVDHASTREEVEEKQRRYAEYRGWL